MTAALRVFRQFDGFTAVVELGGREYASAYSRQCPVDASEDAIGRAIFCAIRHGRMAEESAIRGLIADFNPAEIMRSVGVTP